MQFLNISITGFWGFVDDIINKINGKKIEEYNSSATLIKKKANEITSKAFTKIAKNGMDMLSKYSKEAGVNDPPLESDLPIIERIFSEKINEIVLNNYDLINLMLDSASFVKDFTASISAEDFRGPIFYGFCVFILFTIVASVIGNMLHSIPRIISIIVLIVAFIWALLYLPLKIKKMKKKMLNIFEGIEWYAKEKLNIK